MQFVPRQELEQRLGKIQTLIRSARLDGLLVLQKADVYYFSGTAQNGVLFLPPEGDPVFAVKRSANRARQESAWAAVVPLLRMGDLPDLLKEHGHGRLARVGLELDVLPFSLYSRLGQVFEGVDWSDASPIIGEVRMVKSAYEIERIERAAEQLRVVMAAIPEMLKDGCEREIDLAARIEGALRRERHQGLVRTRGFGREMYYGAVSSGASASFPTDFDGPDGMEGLYPAVPQNGGERLLRRGEPIMVDLCGGYDGYIADKTRIFVPGGLHDEELLGAHAFALSVQSEIQSMLRPGGDTSAIYNEVMKLVSGTPYVHNFMGYGDSRAGFVGHGVGLELDELPVLTARSKVVLKEGMVIAVEPKFFFGDRGGVGIENTWVITRDGCRNLTADNDEIVSV